MPAQFTRSFATRTRHGVPDAGREATGNEVIKRGVAYVAPGDYHLMVEASGVELRTACAAGRWCTTSARRSTCCFQTAARLRGVRRVALLLTGMGADGADGWWRCGTPTP
jgi:two-component system chemotaxis response regulator CheB